MATGQTAQALFPWLIPLGNGHITQYYGQNGERGIDIGTRFHTRITAVADGIVLGAGYYIGGGVVSIGYDKTRSIYYQHLDTIQVGIGQRVSQGDVIGLSGGQLSGGAHPSSPAVSSGPHTEIGINGPWGGIWHPLGPNQNPLPLLQAIVANPALGRTGAGAPQQPPSPVPGQPQSDTTGGNQSGQQSGTPSLLATVTAFDVASLASVYTGAAEYTHKTVSHINGFDGLALALDYAEQLHAPNLLNPVGSVLADAKAICLRAGLVCIGLILVILVLVRLSKSDAVSDATTSASNALGPGLRQLWDDSPQAGAPGGAGAGGGIAAEAGGVVEEAAAVAPTAALAL